MEHDNQTIRQFLCPFGFEPPNYVWKKMHLRTVPAKAVLVLAGSNLNAIDILLQGEIHVVNSFSDGKEFGYTNERSLTLLGDIEYFSGVKQYASSVIAKTTVTLAELDLESFQYWFDCDKLFRDHVVAHIAQKAYKMAGRFGTEKYEDAIYRLTKTILDYLPDRAEHGGMLALHYSHFELAFLSGMSERSVNRVLKRLKEEKLVTIGRKRVLIWPKDVQRLRTMLEQRY